MKKSALVIVLVLTALLFQYCTKSAESATTVYVNNSTIYGYINDTLWTPTKYNATITYTAATKAKVFTCTASVGTQQVVMTATRKNASSVGNGFPVITFSVDPTNTAASSSSFIYGRAATATPTNFIPQGTIKSGYLIVSAIDSVKQTITGTFNFNTVYYTYDLGGNITSITVNAVSGGTINTLPYTYTKQ